jgi:hypothetical protein
MNRHVMAPVLAVAVSTTLWGTREAGAQSLDSRVSAARTRVVRFTMPAGPGVCGNGASWYRSLDGRSGNFNGMWNGSVNNRDVETVCERGPVRVVIEREAGDTKAVRVYVGGRWKADTGITDLGAVGAREGGAWLLQVAEQGPDRVARSAIQAAMLVDSLDATATLLRLARSESRSADVRANAVHRLGELVGERVSSSLDSIAYEAGDRDVRRSAIMAIARRPKAEAVPALVKLAETLPDRELRRAAVIALAQTREPAALEWLERQLSGR